MGESAVETWRPIAVHPSVIHTATSPRVSCVPLSVCLAVDVPRGLSSWPETLTCVCLRASVQVHNWQFHYTDIDWTVMKYHVSVDCQESYILPRDCALRENIVPRENITILAPPTRDILSVPVDISVILDGQNEWFPQNCMCSTIPQSLVTRLGICVQNKTER